MCITVYKFETSIPVFKSNNLHIGSPHLLKEYGVVTFYSKPSFIEATTTRIIKNNFKMTES